MKRKSIAEAVIVAAALLGLCGFAQESVDAEFGTSSLEAVAAGRVEPKSVGTQESKEEEVIDYTGMDNPTGKAEESGSDPYMETALSEEDWEDTYEQDFYERHKDMDFDGDGEITLYEELRWDFIHADLEVEIADLKRSGRQTFYLDTYLSAYMEMDTDEFEDLSLMERADRMEEAYAQMCSDRNMTMEELEEIFETDLSGIVQEIRQRDPHYWGDSVDEIPEFDPRNWDFYVDDSEE